MKGERGVHVGSANTSPGFGMLAHPTSEEPDTRSGFQPLQVEFLCICTDSLRNHLWLTWWDQIAQEFDRAAGTNVGGGISD